MGFLHATTSNKAFIVAIILLLGISMSNGQNSTGAPSIGVCNGRIADDLPSEQDVVTFYQINGIEAMRIYDPNQLTLQALKGTNIQLILGVPNAVLQSLTNPLAATDYVNTNIVSYFPAVKFRYISVGNEVKPTDPESQFVLLAMQNVHNALVSANLHDQIKVSTSVEPSLLGQSYPPSSGVFSEISCPYITPIINFLTSTQSPLLANIYTYFSYIGDTKNIDLCFALFMSPGIVVQDGSLGYQNLFDATLDALYSALEKSGAKDMEIVVSESGWPSAGGMAATLDNARTYYQNLINHVRNGTPKRPGKPIETYLFAMFDENQKGPAATEQHFGLFSPNKQPKYPIKFI
ncbi:Glycoside hydrolase, family 17 [Corchorus olitorius]|uniref:glucan endo-1,3-beta-D-glucosidase n=1 Tax=Corchorus olitorius TaxID=93759 RepID=A0A1R3G8R3_9ROSI|nr:Glycoside hydrolase, family 17 [Corchorus olitorius]